jgi:hypothetical protein
MPYTKLFLIAGLLFGLGTVPAAFAATATFIVQDETTQGAWRSSDVAKPLDLDGDNAYGTAGYMKTSTLLDPSWATLAFVGGEEDAPNGVYIAVDNISSAIGPGVTNENAQTRYLWPVGNFTWHDAATITLTADQTFRISMLYDVRNDNANYNSTGFQITGTGGADSGEILLVNETGGTLGKWAVFELSGVAGDVFTVRIRAGSRGEAEFTRMGLDVVPGAFTGIEAGPATLSGNTVSVTFTDTATSFVDVAKTRSMLIDNVAVIPIVISKTGAITTLSYTKPAPFDAGALLSIQPTVTTTTNLAVTGTRTVRVPFVSIIVGGGTFITQQIWPNGNPQMNDADGVLAALEDPSGIPAVDQITVKTRYIHFNDNVGAPYHEDFSSPYPLWDEALNTSPGAGGTGQGDRNDFAIRCRGRISTTKAGKCWFICNSDDGFVLKIDDVEIGRRGNGGRGNTVMSVDLTAGLHEVDFIHWERSAGAGCTVYIHMGVSETAPPESAESYELLQTLFVAPTDTDAISSVTTSGNNLIIVFKPSNAAATYQLARSTNLVSWTTLTDVPVVAGGNVTFTTAKPAADAKVYYRIVK